MRDILQNRYQITQMLYSIQNHRQMLHIYLKLDIPTPKCPNTLGLGKGIIEQKEIRHLPVPSIFRG